MGKEILDLKPQGIWKNFYELTQIPRPSKKEEKAVEFVKAFGEKLGLETIVDEVGNVIIKKPATKGMENRKGIILQGHVDMVPQKNSGTKHDFEKDPIDAYVEDGWVKAKGTTLGSDNGMGVAAALTVLEATDLEHGPVEGLFTVDEETGMTGAFALKPGLLDGDILLNMDSEDEGELYIGCAGGVDTVGTFTLKTEVVKDGFKAYEIKVSGLKGGHSGLDIHLRRGNANKIMNVLLLKASEKYELQLCSIHGGSLRNAIPRESFATVVVPEAHAQNFETFIAEFHAIVQDEFKETDPNAEIAVSSVDTPKEAFERRAASKFYQAVLDYPNGVIAMSQDMPDIVETSTNLAVVKSDGNKIELASLQRSSDDSAKAELAKKCRKIIEDNGGVAESSGDYPGWKPNVDSPILKQMKEVYNNKYGKVPEVKVIHAGLECGILGAAYPDWDMISFGPTIRNPHSPDEMVHIETVEKFWDYLVETLKHAPEK